jgi:hypothetical protein
MFAGGERANGNGGINERKKVENPEAEERALARGNKSSS